MHRIQSGSFSSFTRAGTERRRTLSGVGENQQDARHAQSNRLSVALFLEASAQACLEMLTLSPLGRGLGAISHPFYSSG